jgi:hypothetical protein
MLDTVLAARENEHDHRLSWSLHNCPGEASTFSRCTTRVLRDPSAAPAKASTISDDEICESIEVNQLKLQKLRGSDLTIFSREHRRWVITSVDEQILNRLDSS